MPRTNYKEFKKIHEDANIAMLRHPEGHEIKVAKGALSDHMKKQISSLKFCDGGAVQAMATGGQVEPMTDAKGNTRDPTGNRYDKYNPPLDASKSNPNYKETPEKPHAVPVQDESVVNPIRHAFGYADGGPVEEPHGGMSMPDGTEMQPSMQQAVPDVVSQMANLNLPDTAAPQAGPMNPVIPQAAPAPAFPQQENFVEQGMNAKLQGVNQEAQATGAMGAGELKDAKENTKKLLDLDTLHIQNQTKIQNELDSVIHDYNQGKIDPNQYWNNRGTLGKMGTAIGLILGGMSSGVTGGPNPVLQFVNAQIDRDIEGQKAEAGRKMNMISALQHQLGNNIDATNMAKSMQAGVFASKLMEEAAKSKDPMAMARAKQMSGEILATYGPLVQKTALRQTVMQGMQNGQIDPAKAINVMVDDKDKHLAYDELKKYENQKVALGNLQGAMDKVSKLQTLTGRLGSPVQSRSQIAALNTQIAGHVKEIFGRPSETEIALLNKNAINLTDDKQTRQEKVDNIMGMINSHESSFPVLRANGISLPPLGRSKFHK